MPPGRSPQRGTSRVSLLVAVLAFVVFAAGCGDAERPSLIGPEGVPADELSRGSDGGTPVTTGVLDPAAATSSFADTGDTFSATDDPEEGSGSQPELFDGELAPVEGGVNAIITPTGVLAAILGRVDDAYVVETPCGFQAVVPWGQPLTTVDVMLDPGHGGDEEGAVAESGLTEASVNMRVAQRTASLLSERGVSVALTRSGDYRMPIVQRAGLADALEAKALVSIHHNTPQAAESTVPGTEVYVQSTSTEARRLGGLVYERVVAGLAQFDIPWVARTDAGVLNVLNDEGQDAYGINRRPVTPSALIEIGYLANPAEADLFASEEYVAVTARAMADGIEVFLTSTDPGSGFVAASRSFNPSGSTGGQSDCVDPPLN